MSETAQPQPSVFRAWAPNWPPAVWMVFATLAIGLIGGLGAPELIQRYNQGFGFALGEFALILLPSFGIGGGDGAANNPLGERCGGGGVSAGGGRHDLPGHGLRRPVADLRPPAARRRLRRLFRL